MKKKMRFSMAGIAIPHLTEIRIRLLRIRQKEILNIGQKSRIVIQSISIVAVENLMVIGVQVI